LIPNFCFVSFLTELVCCGMNELDGEVNFSWAPLPSPAKDSRYGRHLYCVPENGFLTPSSSLPRPVSVANV